MKLKIYQILNANMSLDKLISQDIEYPINVSYKLNKIKLELENVEDYILKRLYKVFGEVSFNSLNDEQKLVYNTLIQSDIDIEIPKLNIGDVVNNYDIKISIKDMKNIEALFDKNG